MTFHSIFIGKALMIPQHTILDGIIQYIEKVADGSITFRTDTIARITFFLQVCHLIFVQEISSVQTKQDGQILIGFPRIIAGMDLMPVAHLQSILHLLIKDSGIDRTNPAGCFPFLKMGMLIFKYNGCKVAIAAMVHLIFQ